MKSDRVLWECSQQTSLECKGASTTDITIKNLLIMIIQLPFLDHILLKSADIFNVVSHH